MKKDSHRIIGCSLAMTEYPEITESLFDQRLRAGLTWVMIGQQMAGLDRRELDRSIKQRKRKRGSAI